MAEEISRNFTVTTFRRLWVAWKKTKVHCTLYLFALPFNLNFDLLQIYRFCFLARILHVLNSFSYGEMSKNWWNFSFL